MDSYMKWTVTLTCKCGAGIRVGKDSRGFSDQCECGSVFKPTFFTYDIHVAMRGGVPYVLEELEMLKKYKPLVSERIYHSRKDTPELPEVELDSVPEPLSDQVAEFFVDEGDNWEDELEIELCKSRKHKKSKNSRR